MRKETEGRLCGSARGQCEKGERLQEETEGTIHDTLITKTGDCASSSAKKSPAATAGAEPNVAPTPTRT